MNALTIIGVILIGLGVVGLIYGGITYTTSKDAVDMGPMHLQVDQQKKIPIPPLVGALAVVIGAALVYVGGRRSTGKSS